MSANIKPITLRLPGELADDLETVALVDRQPIAEVVRAAIASYVGKRRPFESGGVR